MGKRISGSTGFYRQSTAVVGDAVSLLLDTLAGHFDPQAHSDRTYSHQSDLLYAYRCAEGVLL